jgi:hypothetical protein
LEVTQGRVETIDRMRRNARGGRSTTSPTTTTAQGGGSGWKISKETFAIETLNRKLRRIRDRQSQKKNKEKIKEKEKINGSRRQTSKWRS